jgi:hypothetical protein
MVVEHYILLCEIKITNDERNDDADEDNNEDDDNLL